MAAALLTLVRASNPGDEEFVMEFNENAEDAPEFYTVDTEQLADKLKRTDASGQTLRDAVSMGIAQVARLGKNDRKVLVIVTDGEDNSSSINLERLKREAEQRGVMVYAIGCQRQQCRRGGEPGKIWIHSRRQRAASVWFQRAGRSGRHRKTRRARFAESVHDCLYPADQRRDGTFPPHQTGSDFPADAIAKTRDGYYASLHGES